MSVQTVVLDKHAIDDVSCISLVFSKNYLFLLLLTKQKKKHIDFKFKKLIKNFEYIFAN